LETAGFGKQEAMAMAMEMAMAMAMASWFVPLPAAAGFGPDGRDGEVDEERGVGDGRTTWGVRDGWCLDRSVKPKHKPSRCC